MTAIAAVEALRLEQNAAVAELVEDRIFRQVLPQDCETSAIVLHVKQAPDETQSGPGMVLVDAEIHCYGEAAVAEDIAAAVESCIDGTEITFEGITLYTCHERTRMDIPYSEATRLYGIAIKAQYWARPA